MKLDRRPRPWADLVFHVLAHVRGTAALPASLYDARYVALVERQLGPASSRTLEEDARALAELAPTHEALAETQLLAWLFQDLGRASAVVARELGDLHPEDVDAPALVPGLLRRRAAVELLRCAAELERDSFERLAPSPWDADALEQALDEASALAPDLSSATVACIRSLALRGRVLGAEIWVGIPSEELGVSREHVVWQASHEATVWEVSRAGRRSRHDVGERDVEAVAVVLLAERALRAGKGAEHRRYLEVFGPHRPATERHALGPEQAELVATLLAG